MNHLVNHVILVGSHESSVSSYELRASSVYSGKIYIRTICCWLFLFLKNLPLNVREIDYPLATIILYSRILRLVMYVKKRKFNSQRFKYCMYSSGQNEPTVLETLNDKLRLYTHATSEAAHPHRFSFFSFYGKED